ncbi:hypothetical protein BH11CYA1_BH11CYA1_50480 [soil metagenome]
MTDKPTRVADSQAKSSSSEEGGLSFHGIMSGLSKAKDAVVDGGSKVYHKSKDLVEENAPKVKHAVEENAPKVKQAAIDAAHSKTGKAVIAAGTEAYQDEKRHAIGIGDAAKRGDVKTLVREGAPLLAGPQGYVAERVIGQVTKQGVKALPAEHQGEARAVLEVGKVASGGIPDAKHVITGVVLDSDKRGQAMDVAKHAGNKVLGWFKGGDSEADGKAEQKQSGARKSDLGDYPTEERQQKDLPKRPATKK